MTTAALATLSFTLLLNGASFGADVPPAETPKAGAEKAPSELQPNPGHGAMSPSTGAVRNPNDPDAKDPEHRSRDEAGEMGRGDSPAGGGAPNAPATTPKH